MPSLSIAKNDSRHISFRSDPDLIETKQNIPVNIIDNRPTSTGPIESSENKEKLPSEESHLNEREKIHVDEKMKKFVDKNTDSTPSDNDSTGNGSDDDSKSFTGTGPTSKEAKESHILDEGAMDTNVTQENDQPDEDEQSDEDYNPGDLSETETKNKSGKLEENGSAYNDHLDGDENSNKEQAQNEEKTKNETKNMQDDIGGKQALNGTQKHKVGGHTDSLASDTSGNHTARNEKNKEKESNSSPTKSSSQNSDGRSHVGRKGDPRMHASVAAKISNPTLKLYEALIQGGFEYDADKDADKDEDGVTLVQRKNQLRRRLRKLNIPRDNKFSKKKSLSPMEENNSKQGNHKSIDQRFDKQLFPMSMYYQPPHMMHMPQQFGCNLFPPGTKSPLPCPTDKEEDKSSKEPNEDNKNPKTNDENEKEGNLNENGESESSESTPNPNKMPDYPIPPYYTPQSTFGFPPFHPPYPLPLPPGYNFEEKKQGTNDKSIDSSSLVDDAGKNSKVNEAQDALSSNTNEKLKLNKSCDRCRRRKVKCDGKDPCSVCVNDRARLRKKAEKLNTHTTLPDDHNFGIECCYSYSMKRGPPAGRNKRRKKSGNNKNELNIKPMKGPFPGINMPPGGASMIPPHMMPFCSQFPPPTLMMNDMQQPNMPTNPPNQAPFGMNYPPYPFPFTNNPVTDGIYSQAILAAARSVLLPPGSKSDEGDTDKNNESSASSQTSKDLATK